MLLYKKRLLFCLLSTSLTASANGPSCQSLFKKESPFKDYPFNLAAFYNHENLNFQVADLVLLNQQTLKKLQDYKPETNFKKASQISYAQGADIVNAISRHSVVSSQASQKYQPQHTSIGYCFGRAMFAHIMLLKMGLQKESILKIWAVGEMNAGDHLWDFHVATLAYNQEQGWIAIDTSLGRPVSVDVWMKQYSRFNQNGRLRFYVTPAEKFGYESGKYSRIQMGLDLSVQQDWYQNYFVDMMKSIRENSIENLGLQKLEPDQPQIEQDKFKINSLIRFFTKLLTN